MISDMHYKKDETMKMCYNQNIPLTAYILDPDEQAKVDKPKISFENAYKLLKRHADHSSSGHKTSDHKTSGHKTSGHNALVHNITGTSNFYGKSLSPISFKTSNLKKTLIPGWVKAIGS
jgi:hypothetical protein